jgi:hypothetical protein
MLSSAGSDLVPLFLEISLNRYFKKIIFTDENSG